MQFGDRATRRNKRPTDALQRVKREQLDYHLSDDEDDGCAALLALQSAVPSRPPASSPRALPSGPKRGKAEDEHGNQYASSQYDHEHIQMDKRKQKRASSSGDTGPENGPASSGGSAEDILYAVPLEEGQGQKHRLNQDEMTDSQGDELSDMEVDIISETEKGCQVWFPPLPGEMERRRFQRSGAVGLGMNQTFNASGLRASKRKLGLEMMESGPSDGSWDMGLLMGMPIGGAFPGMDDGTGGKLRCGVSWEEEDGGEDGSSLKEPLQHEGTGSKRRLIWSQELHERFLAAIRKLGVKNAVPKAILNLMGVEVS